MVSYGRLRPEAPACAALLAQWRDVRSGRTEATRRQARALLSRLPDERLAFFGLVDGAYARSWLAAEPMAAGLAFSLLLLEGIERIPGPGPSLWRAMQEGDPALGLPAGPLRRAAAGRPLARWLDRLAGLPRSPATPPDAHLGGWMRGDDLLRLARLLRPPGTDPRHDALRAALAGARRGDWVAATAIW